MELLGAIEQSWDFGIHTIDARPRYRASKEVVLFSAFGGHDGKRLERSNPDLCPSLRTRRLEKRC